MIISGRLRRDWKMVSSDAQAACKFLRSKPRSDCPYSRFSDCGYAADNLRAFRLPRSCLTRNHATAVPASPQGSRSLAPIGRPMTARESRTHLRGFLESGRDILRQSEALSSSQPVFCWLTVHRQRPRILIRQARSEWRDFVGFADGELERSCAPAISIAQ